MDAIIPTKNIKHRKNKIILKLRKNIHYLLILIAAIFFLGLPALMFAEESGTDTNKQAGDIQDNIEKLQNKIAKEQKAKQQLEQELQSIQQSVSSTGSEIKKTETMIASIQNDIERKETEIQIINEKISTKKETLKDLVREMYYETEEPVLHTVLKEDSISQMMGKFDYLSAMKEKLDQMLVEMDDIRNLITDEKQDIKDKEEEGLKLLSMKQDQQQILLSEKKDTQIDIGQKDATIGELQSKLGKLRSDLSDLLGNSYDASDIEDAAKFAANATGVRKDFIMGMLVVESDLGRFTGGCYAKDSRMSGTRLSLFKDICSELDYSWGKRKVSCPPKGYKGTGGAMGVAQFMSDTWTSYKSQIASVTGHHPPDPWNLTDGVAAMALKLSKVSGVTDHKKSGECNAAKLYLSGTTSSKYQWYCDKVLYWADNYERLLD
jgi:peptidoglycan hydrolase CwlO-like protein